MGCFAVRVSQPKPDAMAKEAQRAAKPRAPRRTSAQQRVRRRFSPSSSGTKAASRWRRQAARGRVWHATRTSRADTLDAKGPGAQRGTAPPKDGRAGARLNASDLRRMRARTRRTPGAHQTAYARIRLRPRLHLEYTSAWSTPGVLPSQRTLGARQAAGVSQAYADRRTPSVRLALSVGPAYSAVLRVATTTSRTRARVTTASSSKAAKASSTRASARRSTSRGWAAAARRRRTPS